MNKEISAEFLKNPEIEQIFNKVETVPLVGGVLASALKKNVIEESMEVKNGAVFGKAKIKFGERNPLFMLDKHSDYEEAHLTIFSSTKEAESREVVRFVTHVRRSQPPFPLIYISTHFNENYIHLPNDEFVRFNNWLGEVVSDINNMAAFALAKK